MSCECGRVPQSFGEPLPRWTILPGDPPDLRRWLRAADLAEKAGIPTRRWTS